MGLVTVRFEVMNDVQFARAFEVASNEISDLSVPFSEMATEFYTSMTQVFSSEGSYEGRPRWATLSPAYARWKMKHFPGRKILERTGSLLVSLCVRGAMGNVTDITPNSLSLGTNISYAKYHQTGTSRMPMRKIIELTQTQKTRWVQIIHGYLGKVYESVARNIRRT